MEVHFCEEYPSEKTLAPACLVRFPAMVFLAAETRADFEQAAAQLRAVSALLTPAWWPVPTESRAISVFCNRPELDAIRVALETMPPEPILLDLELPLWEPRRMLASLGRMKDARHGVDLLFAASIRRHEVWTAEYPPALPSRVLRWLRLVLPQASMRTYMAYSSMLPPWWRRLLLRRLRPRFASTASAVGVGALAVGIAGNEPVLPPSRLAADLREASDAGAAAAMIYRLGGLTPGHAAAIATFRSTAGERPARNWSGFIRRSTRVAQRSGREAWNADPLPTELLPPDGDRGETSEPRAKGPPKPAERPALPAQRSDIA